ncbi:hypothetical protein [Pseudoxanthomonas winnipegensis]|uniref:hypothetical protein n=1 Tax=Pseudoxanthomonas winnipegensis TaxID=2480810 RepID=UPI001038B25C|nr:hypothetical protein [Pseudoxanthomonas winnipegensis]TBV69170.1 hypothetical protein EYC45_19825 [Pseudoxanthomonas winnipegensis]
MNIIQFKAPKHTNPTVRLAGTRRRPKASSPLPEVTKCEVEDHRKSAWNTEVFALVNVGSTTLKRYQLVQMPVSVFHRIDWDSIKSMKDVPLCRIHADRIVSMTRTDTFDPVLALGELQDQLDALVRKENAQDYEWAHRNLGAQHKPERTHA